MASPVLIKNRYEVKDVLGRGGMGVVYKAFDTLIRREVAVKTLRDVASQVFVDLFYRECSVLTAMVHPNIVEIFDMGEFEEDGVLKPYFVMPLLPGRTLYDLIYPEAKALPPERCTDIISQSCRGLHAAHECGLLHRDIKPRNIFVMRDDAVKLIDFGVVRLLGGQTLGTPGTLGTLHYMAPEQIAMKPLTARSDIFSLATVCYEALTGVHPFLRANDAETAAAVADHTPALACALNPLVNRPLAQAVAQAMAKDPRNRFESAIAFADALQRGARNERAGVTPLTNPQNRLARAQRSFARGDCEFAMEIVEQLEAEGIDGPEVQRLRSQLEEALRQRQSDLHLATAQRYFDEDEHALALRRVMEVLETNPSNAAALTLKTKIEDKLNDLHVDDSLHRASLHLDNGAFKEARRLIEHSLELRPENAEAQRLLKETDQRAVDWPRQRRQQEELFQTAQSAYFEGRFETSLRTLEQLTELASQSKAAGARVTEYEDFSKRVRGDLDSLQSMLADARKRLANDDLENAFILSERLREQCPQDPQVRTLSADISTRRAERDQEFRRGIELSIENEPDLSARLHILNQAARSRPHDDRFHQERQKVQAQLQKVTELVQRAQVYEASGRFDYALEEWLCVRDIYPAYPGLDEQLKRVKAAWESAREQTKLQLHDEVTEAVKKGDQQRAADLLKAAQADFQGDADYSQLQTLFNNGAEAHKQASALLSRLAKAEAERRFIDIPALAHAAAAVSGKIDPLRAQTFATLMGAAARVARRNWRVAQQVLDEAARLGDVPPDIHLSIAAEEREEEITGILGENRVGQSNLREYRERVVAMLDRYPGETRLEDRLRSVDAALAAQKHQDEKSACVAQLARISKELGDASDHRRLWDGYIHAKNVAAPFAEDQDVVQLLESIREQGSQFEAAADALTRDRIKDCYAICDHMIDRRPGHVLFQKLRDQASSRHRQLGEEYQARVERWLASEPDLDQRELILKKAQEEFPFETRYAEELQILEREKVVAESTALKARDLEKRGQIPEALAQWRQLRNIHLTYPGVDESISRCESIIDRQQRKVRAQRLLSQGETHLAEGQFVQGYLMIREASELSQDIPDLLRSAAPNLVVAARNVLPSNPKVSEALVNLAQKLDEELSLPKEMRTGIAEARKAEDVTDCLNAIQTYRDAGNFTDALAIADQCLVKYPGVKQVEWARGQVLGEMEQERKQRIRTETLNQFRELELGAVSMSSSDLQGLKQSVHEIAGQCPGDEEVSQRASTLGSLFAFLAEVRGHLEERSPAKAEEASARAMAVFPAHPLFKSALAEADRQRAQQAADELNQIKRRLAMERDLTKQAAIAREAMTRYPADDFLAGALASIGDKQKELNGRIEKARGLEANQSFGEAIKEWEAIAKDYPWYTGTAAEIERISGARRKGKEDAVQRWFKQVEDAIDSCDYDTASTMLRQAAQQTPDRRLQGLDAKLQEALKKKKESDAKLEEGSRLLADSDLSNGGKALLQAFELQPRDQDKANAIALLLLGQIRANMSSDMASCETLLSHLNRIRPNQMLPPDIREAVAKQQQASAVNEAGRRKQLSQLATLANRLHNANSNRALNSVAKNLQESGLLNSSDLEVRRTAAELGRKIDLRLSGLERPVSSDPPAVETNPGQVDMSAGTIAAVVLLLLAMAGVIFFMTRPHTRGVPVQISVTPDHSTIELDGHTCVAPDCHLFLQPGSHLVTVSKDGYKPKTMTVTVTPGESTPLNLTAELESLSPGAQPLAPAPSRAIPQIVATGDDRPIHSALAKIKIQGAMPGTRVRLDGSEIGRVSDAGVFGIDVPPGPHTLDLSLDGFSNRTITREFVRGEIVSLADEAVQLEPRQPEVRR